MNPEIKKQWVEALRSGEYVQGHRTLARIDVQPTDAIPIEEMPVSYCCLGVLCELATKAGIVTKHRMGDEYWYNSSSTYLPDNVVVWAGIDSFNPNNPLVRTGKETTFLAVVNDSEGVSFDEIANIIEEQL